MKYYVAGIISLMILLPIASITNAQGDTATNIQGTWKIISCETSGDKMSAEEIAKSTVKITADSFTISMDGRDDSMKYRVNLQKKPMEFDFVTESFAKGADKATEHVQPGIFDLKDDVLRVCVGVFRPGKKDGDGKLTQPQIDAKRPTEFKAGPNTGLMVLKRQK